jgi:hypothetical protein
MPTGQAPCRNPYDSAPLQFRRRDRPPGFQGEWLVANVICGLAHDVLEICTSVASTGSVHRVIDAAVQCVEVLRSADDRCYTRPMGPNDKTGAHAGDVGSIESWLVSAGRDRTPGAPLNVPPWPASNFVLGAKRAYARDDATPGWAALEEIVGGLEGGSSVAFASGMAAIAAVFDQLPAVAKVALPDDCYQGVTGLANAGQRRGRWSVRRIAVADTAGWIQACAESDLIWVESPSNPLLVVAELGAICAAPRKRGAILGVITRSPRP